MNRQALLVMFRHHSLQMDIFHLGSIIDADEYPTSAIWRQEQSHRHWLLMDEYRERIRTLDEETA